jgi:hypothetical protein
VRSATQPARPPAWLLRPATAEAALCGRGGSGALLRGAGGLGQLVGRSPGRRAQRALRAGSNSRHRSGRVLKDMKAEPVRRGLTLNERTMAAAV